MVSANNYQITAANSIDGGGNNNTAAGSGKAGWVFPNTVPVAYPQLQTVVAGQQFVITLTGSDSDGLTFTFPNAQMTGPVQFQNGAELSQSTTQLANNQVLYQAPSIPGQDSFTVVAFDGLVYSNPATVTVAVISPPAQLIGITWSDGTTAPRTWAIGNVKAGMDAWAKLARGPQFIVQNAGTGPEQFSVTCGSSTNWTLNSSADIDPFAMQASYDDFGTTNQNLSVHALVLSSVLPNVSKTIGLHFTAPTSTSVPGVQQTITVTITAAAQ